MKGGPVPFGKYLLVDRINVGGMAEVFMAKAFGVEGFERVLAIKRILPNMADDDEFINMFVDEARIAVQLSHANIVQIYELGKFENQYYIAMEYVSGKDLRQILDAYRKKQQTMPIPAAAFIASKLCEGLDYAHRKTDPAGRPLNIIHRDVSPQNILVSFEGAVKITDFGIAKAEDRASKTQAGVLKGKFGYMSPEQVRGLEIDHRSDVFAVGILLYEMIAGKRLFVGESDFSTLEKVRNAEVIPPRQLNPAVSEALEKVMLKALARERDERYAWASDLHDDLQQFLIEENTIYNSKRISNLLKTDFAEDIDRERARMEEFTRVQPPTDLAAAEDMAVQVHGNIDVRGEKTMIFESGGAANPDLSSAPTAVGAEISLPAGSEPVRTGVSQVPANKSRPAGGKSRVSVAAAPAPAPSGKSRIGLLLVGISLLVAAAGVLAVLISMPGSSVGTLVITSDPTEVEIDLDGVRIGSRTPITRTDVATGAHTLRAKARGYAEKMYRFELEGPGSAVIDVKLDPLSNAAPSKEGGQPMSPPAVAGQTTPAPGSTPAPPGPGAPAPGHGPAPGPATAAVTTSLAPSAPGPGTAAPPATPGSTSPAAATGPARVEIVSEPSEAKVRVAGVQQGVTPMALVHNDVTKPLVFDVVKPDYRTYTETVTLKPGEQRRITIKLVPAAGGVASKAKLSVRSDPDGATVFSGPNRLGLTPLEIPNLDANQSYSIKVVKDGFRQYETTVAMQGRSEVVVSVTLERERKPASQAESGGARRHSDAGGGAGGATAGGNAGGASGGGCSGTGAKLSVMARGVPDCRVAVGRVQLGVSPFFNKDAPSGKCEIVVTCPDGKKYSEMRVLKAGSSEKLIIESTMWK